MNNLKQIAIVGLGLLGGSFALALRKQLAAKIYGTDHNPVHIKKAIELKLIDSEIEESHWNQIDLVVIAIPVDKIPEVTTIVLNKIKKGALVFDTGSIKAPICQELRNHPKRNQFLAVHPIAGTEFSGPEAALENLFENKKCILCDTQGTQPELLKLGVKILEKLNMQIDYMDSEEHDKHIAYVSHLSHISSFMLGKTVLEIEKNEQNIFNMAGSGFASTVRLAKSSATTWTPIFLENKEPILKALKEYIKNLENFAQEIENDNFEVLYKIMKETNYIGKVIKG
jgi:prephenate dehydrogenase